MAGDLIVRSYPVSATADGRTITMNCVPLDTPTVVRDADGDPYRESIATGAFRRLASAAHRVALRAGHDRSPFADIGKGLEFSEVEGFLRGVFRADDTPFAQHALFKVQDGQWRYASIGAVILRTQQVGDVSVRTLLHLDHVALTDRPQYAGAEVLSVRDTGAPTPRLARWIGKYPLS